MSKLVLTTKDRRPLGPVYPNGFAVIDDVIVGPGGDPCPLPDDRKGAQLVKVNPRTADAVMDADRAGELDGLVIDDQCKLVPAKAKKGGKAKAKK